MASDRLEDETESDSARSGAEGKGRKKGVPPKWVPATVAKAIGKVANESEENAHHPHKPAAKGGHAIQKKDVVHREVLEALAKNELRQREVQLEVFRSPEHTIVSIGGDAGALATDRIEKELTAVAEEGPTRVIVDLSKTSYISTPVIAMLLGLDRALDRNGGRMQLVVPRSNVRDVLTKARLNAVLKMYLTLDGALQE